MISIIVPVYNAETYIRKTIEYVAAQTYSDWELILVDDCSTDKSIEEIEKKTALLLPQVKDRIHIIRKKENAGAAAARNTGVDNAKGRYIAFLDADDVWHPEKLERTLEFMKEKDAAFVFTSYLYGDEAAVPTGRMVKVPETLTYNKALSRTVIFTSTVLFDTKKLDKTLIHMPLIGSEDTATWWQILRSGVTAYGLDVPLVIYRRPPASLSSDKKKAVKRIWKLYRDFAGLNVIKASYCFALWAVRASVRRVVVRKNDSGLVYDDLR